MHLFWLANQQVRAKLFKRTFVKRGYRYIVGRLPGRLAKGNRWILTPTGNWQPTGALQWLVAITGTITSKFDYRTDSITGDTLATAEDSPILAATNDTVTIANALDNWGGSYGYYVKLDHGNDL